MKNKPTLIEIIICIVIVLCCVAAGFQFYGMIKYGNRPITEVPAWVIFLSMRR